MPAESLDRYLEAFSNLNCGSSRKYGTAPHKPILLLAVLDEIERGAYPDGLIGITPELIGTFRSYWAALVTSDHWEIRMHYPFRHLAQEGWWHFVQAGIIVPPPPGSPSLKRMAEQYEGIRFAPDLWILMQDPTAVAQLRGRIYLTYFNTPDFSRIEREPTEKFLYREIDQLKREATRPFVQRVREQSTDTVYLRHTLFPRVIRGIYLEQCAACQIVTSLGNQSIVDASHIIPFSISHNDDPRNGIALCKNHHWGFDRGWFSLTDNYRLLVSPHLENNDDYVTKGKEILLPVAPILHPSPLALKWHREHVFKR